MDTGRANDRKKSDGDWKSWALIVFLFAVQLWPVALLLLFFKLFGDDGKKQSPTPPLQTASAPRPTAASARTGQPARAKSAVQKVTRSPAAKKSNAKWLKIVGVVLTVVGFAAASDSISALFWSSDWVRLWLWEFLEYLSVAVSGLGMFFGGVAMERAVKRYARYLSVIGDREAMDVGQLARTLGYPEKRVEKDLQKMIEKGYFGDKAYLNVELGYLFRSSQASADFEQRQRAESETPPREAEEGYSGILRDIRRANDRIADPVLSEKIDRLEEITARIFKAVEEDPKKRGRIDTFLNYYLPTTQKLLDSYAEFESTGIEGENLRQAKERIRATMDSIIAGFAHQLDELYQTDAMDVDSDIRVMETMLGRDTASVEKDFGLGRTDSGAEGGTAVQQKPEEL